MLLPIKPICERKVVCRDGTCLIHIQYCYSSVKRTIVNTQLSIPPNYWNKSAFVFLTSCQHGLGTSTILINSELDRMIRLTEDIVSYATRNKIEDRGGFVKTFKPDFDISTFNKLDVLKINEGLQEKKFNRNLFF